MKVGNRASNDIKSGKSTTTSATAGTAELTFTGVRIVTAVNRYSLANAREGRH